MDIIYQVAEMMAKKRGLRIEETEQSYVLRDGDGSHPSFGGIYIDKEDEGTDGLLATVTMLALEREHQA